MKTTRHTCPRDCFDACGMIAHVNDRGRLIKVSGESQHRYTNGKLCCKGYAYTQYVYHPDRLLYPMLQTPRHSGNWKRISWDEAGEMISKKIININDKYGNYLPIAYMKGGGNYGALSEATKGLFTSLGPISIVNAAGALCLASAWDAQLLDFGGYISPEPSEMEDAKMVILWGVNPAATATHQIPIIDKVKARGGKVVLIDIYPSKTNIFVDQFVQVKPGGDGALALAILQQLIFTKEIDDHEINKYSGWEQFYNWLIEIEPHVLNKVSGVDASVVTQLAKDITTEKRVAFWLGMGMQRYSNGGQNVRNIHALAVASGNVDGKGAGIFFPRTDHWKFNYHFNSFSNYPFEKNRIIGVNSLAQNIANCKEPPIDMLWVTSCNPLARCTDLKALRTEMNQVDFIVTVDHFLTTTAKASDLVLPATTCFEAWDIVASYWHHWVGINQPAIEPLGECRSELQIAKILSKCLNETNPNLTAFPWEDDDETWVAREFSPLLCKQLHINSYRDLLKGPRLLDFTVKNQTEITHNNSGKYRFQVPEAMLQGNPELPILITPINPPKTYPYRFLLLHQLENLNSQLTNIEWLTTEQTDQQLLLSPKTAENKGIVSGQKIVIYNHIGEVHLLAKINKSLPDDIVICYSWYDLHGELVNVLTETQETDLGRMKYQYPGVAYHDTFVNIVKAY